MKRRLCGLIAALLLLPCLPVYADIIYTPPSSFVDRHLSEVTFVDRDYYVTDAAGAALHREPGSRQVVGTAPKGTAFTVYYTYEKGGLLWGLVEPSQPDPITGWLDMARMELVYDGQSFQEEHAGDFEDYTGDFSELEGVSGIVVWDYPGAPTRSGYSGGTFDDANIAILYTYTGEDGLLWGYFPNVMHHRNVWICLSEPTGEQPTAPRPLPYTQRGIYEPADRSGFALPLTAVVAILIAALVVGTALLIRKVYRPGA